MALFSFIGAQLKSLERYSMLFVGFTFISAWLIPNHQLPWTTFHSDLVVSIGLVVLGYCVFYRYQGTAIELSPIHFSLVGLIFVSLGYKWLANEHYWTQSLLPALYFFGFFLAILVGQLLVREASPNFDAIVFIPALVAAMISVGLQLAQWLHLPSYEITDIWIVQTVGIRPAANLNQPNQLATLLLWGCASAMHYFLQKKISLPIASLAIAFICFGVGLTLSRTALLSYFLISILFFIVNRVRLQLKHVIFWLLPTFVLLASWNLHSIVPGLLNLSNAGDSAITNLNRDGGLRLTIWHMFIAAILEKPLFGFGPLMNLAAQYSQLSNFPELGGVLYANSHNIVIELALWYGLPVAAVVLLIWGRMLISLGQSFFQVENQDKCLIVVLLLMLVHASLELPLHHAYFLLPVGLIVGGLLGKGSMLFSRYKLLVPVRFLLGLIIFSFISVIYLTKEYLEIEKQVVTFRFREANIANTPDLIIPKLFMLDQLSAQLQFNSVDTNAQLSDVELKALRRYVDSYTYCDVVEKFLQILVNNEKMEDADTLRVSMNQKCGRN